METLHKLPRIGVTPDINEKEAPETEYFIRKNYAEAVASAGGLPFIIPYNIEQAEIYIENLDGLVVTGGMFDIDPPLYGQAARKAFITKPTRTLFERALILSALRRQVPVLGICNGMQILAVCLGGELVQDIPTEIKGALEHKPDGSATSPQHSIDVDGSSLLVKYPGKHLHSVNSVHRQSVLPGDQFRPIATAPDGVIEAFEVVNQEFCLGVQWHPEYYSSELDGAIWLNFVNAARRFSERSAAFDAS